MANRSKTILRVAVMATAMGMAPALSATTITATLIPSPPVSREPLVVRLADTQGPHCWPAASSTERVGTVVTVSLSFSDSCNKSNVVPYRDYALGSFATGNYLFVYRSCSSNPPPLPSTCNTVLQLPFSIVIPVPTLSWWGILGLIGGVLAIFAWASRLARRSFTRPPDRID